MVAAKAVERAQAQLLAEMISVRREKDKHRDWRAETVNPETVHPTNDELAAYLEESGASMAGLGDTLTMLNHGKYPGPLMLMDRGKEGLWLDASTHGLGGPNSVALLVALRRSKKDEWPAAVYKDKAQKDDGEEDDSEEWSLDPGTKEDARADMTEFVLGVMAGITLVSEDDLFQIAIEGARYGGGGLSTHHLKGIAREALAFNAEYMAGFRDDALADMDEVLNGLYADESGFIAEADGFIAGVIGRAEDYAAGGKLAWVKGVGEASRANGQVGCIWNCTFGPGSCADCLALHGQYMEWDEFYDTYGETICNGGCNCGPQPAESPGEPPEDLNEEEAA